MSLKPFWRLWANKQLGALLAVNRLFKPFYQLTFLASAQENHLLNALYPDGKNIQQLHVLFSCDGQGEEALYAWLQMGISLGYLSELNGRYQLKGLALMLAKPENDAALALLQEVADLHHRLLMQTPAKIKDGQLWQLSDQNGQLIARSSRALEYFQVQAIRQFFPSNGVIKLLEVGCGSAVYIRHAAQLNPQLVAVGLELQEDVALVARQNIANWQLADRVTIEVGDVRLKAIGDRFDVVSLYNNIYYFPVSERVALFKHLRQFIAPNGCLIVSSCCQRGNLGMQALNLWGAATQGAGRLPSVDELKEQLKQAGFSQITSKRLVVGDAFYAFKATC